MNTKQICLRLIYLFAFLGVILVFHYAYQSRTGFLFIVVNNNDQKFKSRLFDISNFSRTNLLLKHIDQCPECVLFSLVNKPVSENETIFHILNNIPKNSQSVFYPITMKLHYNQPIPYYTILSKNQTGTMGYMRSYWIDYIEKIDNIKTNSILYSILQSLRKPAAAIDYSWPNKTKLILYYTKFFGSTYWYNKDENAVYANDFNSNNCPLLVNTCRVTIDHKFFPESDAALFHLRESINYKKLNDLKRQPNQRFVFFLKESPVHSPVLSSEQHSHIFNYTQTYRPDSDITATTLQNLFWLFNYKIYPDYDFKSIMKTKISGKILVAIISNCGGSSNRLKYINELRQYISVDVYGKCGKSCPTILNCRSYAYSTYKFYLAFENSLCEEYVTEKFLFTVYSGQIVPIVLGWARYDHYIPSTGYIDVRDFRSPRELAAYVDYLDKNTTAYLEYFQWRQYALHIKPPKFMCELCLKLFLDDKDHKKQSLKHIAEYWNRKVQCHNYKKNQNGTWIMK